MSSASGLPDLSTGGGGSSSAAATSAAQTSSGQGSSASATGSSSGNLPSIGASSTSTSSSSISVITNAPSLTSSNGNGLGGLTLTNSLPTLAGAYSYPPPTVPPTAGAPYMQASQLPQNFVFIIVGGVLAFFALIIILWRVLTSWSINRSFKRDNVTAAGGAAYVPLPDMKKRRDVKTEPAHDMADLGNLPKSFSSVPNLFFSPTAEAARQSMVRPASHHQQQHHPSGHYRDGSK